MASINKNCNATGRATEVMLTESAKKGTPGVQIQFTVTVGEFAGAYVRYDGWVTENTAERVIESLQHCGWDGDDIGEFADRGLHGIDRNEVELVIEMEEYGGDDDKYKGKSFPRVAFVNRIGGRGLNVEQAMTPDRAADFGDKMRALVLKSKLKKASSSPNTDSGTDFSYGANAPSQAAAGGKRF